MKHTYDVQYRIRNSRTGISNLCVRPVAIIDGYSTFEDIRRILATVTFGHNEPEWYERILIEQAILMESVPTD